MSKDEFCAMEVEAIPLSGIFLVYSVVMVEINEEYFESLNFVYKHERSLNVDTTIGAQRMPQRLPEFRFTLELRKV